MTDKSKERLTSMNAETPLFGLAFLPKYITKINISLDTNNMAILRTESHLDKEDEGAITQWFARIQENHTLVPTEKLTVMQADLKEYYQTKRVK